MPPPKGTDGYSKGKNLKKIGLKAQDTSELFFQDCRVPKSALLGGLNKGFYQLMEQLPQERLLLGAIGGRAGSGSVTQDDWRQVFDASPFLPQWRTPRPCTSGHESTSRTARRLKVRVLLVFMWKRMLVD